MVSAAVGGSGAAENAAILNLISEIVLKERCRRVLSLARNVVWNSEIVFESWLERLRKGRGILPEVQELLFLPPGEVLGGSHCGRQCGIVPIVLYCGEWEGREVVPPDWEGQRKSSSHCPGFGRGFKTEPELPLAVLGVRIN